ncbi:hypothetical protein GVAV_003205 [Gurleya vavrai]
MYGFCLLSQLVFSIREKNKNPFKIIYCDDIYISKSPEKLISNSKENKTIDKIGLSSFSTKKIQNLSSNSGKCLRIGFKVKNTCQRNTLKVYTFLPNTCLKSKNEESLSSAASWVKRSHRKSKEESSFSSEDLIPLKILKLSYDIKKKTSKSIS